MDKPTDKPTVKIPPHHDAQWHSWNDGTDSACIYGHEYIEGNYVWAEDADGKYKVCLYCKTFTDRLEAPMRELPKVTSRAYSQKSYLRNRRGIRVTTYNAICAAQNGLCAVCKAEPAGDTRLSVDARAGRIVGLLCRRCLSACRMVQNNIDNARALVAYLQADIDTHPEIPDAVILADTTATATPNTTD